MMTNEQIFEAVREDETAVLGAELFATRSSLCALVGMIEGIAIKHSDVVFTARRAREMLPPELRTGSKT